MKRALVWIGLMLPATAVLAADPAPAPSAAEPPPGATAADAPTPGATAPADAPARYRVLVGNRLYPEWSEEHVVALGERFPLGDTEFTATLTRYFRDFKIKDGQAFDASPEPVNPAVFVVVTRDTAAVDSMWAFRNFPPHMSPQSFFTFRMLDLDGAEADAPAAEEGK